MGPTHSEEVLREFMAENREKLQRFESNLLLLENEPDSSALRSELFRDLHTVKGNAGLLGFARLEALTHVAESLLGQLEEGRLTLGREGVSTLLAMVDMARTMLAHIESSGSDEAVDPTSLAARLQRLCEGAPPAESLPPPEPPPQPALPSSLAVDSKVRVDVALLERLMNLVGELVLARNQLVQLLSSQRGTELLSASQRLSLVTGELQQVVMKTRLLPISQLWSRLPRLVRDCAHACGKQVRLRLEGESTELDRTILEAIQDPLTHLLRNAIDHGIEPPEQRAARGKPPVGSLALRASHEGGMVCIELEDDGAGISPQRVRQAAVRRQLLSAEQAERLGEREVLELLFTPGFSTAERLTPLSGRGVGLDVVKSQVERLGGVVDVYTRPGLGTAFKLKIPLTLAIIPALVVCSAGERYTLPQANVLEVVRLEEDKARQEVELLQGAPVFRLRGRLLPLAWLSRELGLAPPGPLPAGSLTLVVLQADERRFGLVVDEVVDTEEIVVKPLWKPLKGIGCYAGATVLGDGRVALILDALGLGQRLGVVGREREQARARQQAEAQAEEVQEQVLLCRLGAEGQVAIPLAWVSRMEELPRSRVEHVGGREVVQYREQLLPLVHLSQALEERRRTPRAPQAPEPEHLSVIVCQGAEGHVGLVVEAIVDVVAVEPRLQRQGVRAGVLGTLVVQGRATEYLDVEAVLRAAGLLPAADSGRP